MTTKTKLQRIKENLWALAHWTLLFGTTGSLVTGVLTYYSKEPACKIIFAVEVSYGVAFTLGALMLSMYAIHGIDLDELGEDDW